MAIHDRHDIHDIHYIRDIHYIHYRQYIHDIQDTHYRHYRHIAFPEVSIHDTTRHDFTSHPDVWQLRAWEGEEDRGEKKAELYTLMLPEVTNTYSSPCAPIRHLLKPMLSHPTPFEAHALPSACRAESCLLRCQPEPSLSCYLPDYHELLRESVAVIHIGVRM